MRILRVQTVKLPVHLTDKEVLAQSAALAYTTQAIANEEETQTALKGQMKATLAGLLAKQTLLASIVVTCTEYRDVEIEIQCSEEGIVQEVRRDTGAIILTRPLREDEKQIALLPNA